MTGTRAGSIALALWLALGGTPAAALDMPQGARALAERVNPYDSYALPIGPYNGETVPSLNVEGRVERLTWRVDGGSATPLQLLAPLRDQLEGDGWDILLDCRDIECGGFDFRFGIEVVPAPDMQVDIRDYRFLSAMRGDDAIGLLVSGGRSAAYIQMIRVRGNGAAAPTSPAPPPPPRPDGLTGALLDQGHAVLGDLAFETGAARLGNGDFASLQALAAFLAENPKARIAVVGHTDSVGSLADNIALSRARARAVRDRLIEAHGADPDRIEAEGMGYLAPRASNLTPEGREANRRVEAVLLSNG